MAGIGNEGEIGKFGVGHYRGPLAVQLGVDTGGTFTDFVWLDQDSGIKIHKVLSTPDDPANAVLGGIDALQLPETARVIHGSTVGTNALLERRGARTALITTRGFADVLAIGRQDRPKLYALVARKPEPLVPRAWRFEVDERVTAEGDVLTPLDPTSLQTILAQMAADQIESVAVCLLFSFLRPEHEQQIRKSIEAWNQTGAGGGVGPSGTPWYVSLSSEILPEFREYERTSTTVINAYVAPIMHRYLNRLRKELSPRTIIVMQSNGGVISADLAGKEAARTVLSGPAGGVVGARYVAGLAGYREVISFDMGGTSTDVALCPGRLPTTNRGQIGYFPLRLPMIDIRTVGAGGGSLAYVDPGGALQVGPKSAGAVPGPACYPRSRASDSPDHEDDSRPPGVTTTDANLVLGRLDAEHFLGGEMRLSEAAARDAMGRLVAEIGETSIEATALGVNRVANITMERALRKISVERGYDPRHFTLVAFGGAGPLHACELARQMQIPRILVPPIPGVLSALGMLVALPTKDYSQTIMKLVLDDILLNLAWLDRRFALLEQRALAEMLDEGYAAGSLIMERSLDMRYVGQSHELSVSLGQNGESSRIAQLFHEAHERRFGYRKTESPVQIVNIRLVVTAQLEPPALPQQVIGGAEATSAAIGEKLVWFGERPVETVIYDRDKLVAGNRISGPALVIQYDTTNLIPSDWSARVDAYGNLILTRDK